MTADQEQTKKRMIERHWELSGNAKFFTGYATSLESLIYSYPEIHNIR